MAVRARLEQMVHLATECVATERGGPWLVLFVATFGCGAGAASEGQEGGSAEAAGATYYGR